MTVYAFEATGKLSYISPNALTLTGWTAGEWLRAGVSAWIDRVVERDGLTLIAWRTDDGTVVDSYFRPQDASARALADAVAGILLPTQTGTDA